MNGTDLFCVLLFVLWMGLVDRVADWWNTSGSCIWDWYHSRLVDNIFYYKWDILGVVIVYTVFICVWIYLAGEIESLPKPRNCVPLKEGGVAFI
jgi:hypothetical protein